MRRIVELDQSWGSPREAATYFRAVADEVEKWPRDEEPFLDVLEVKDENDFTLRLTHIT